MMLVPTAAGPFLPTPAPAPTPTPSTTAAAPHLNLIRLPPLPLPLPLTTAHTRARRCQCHARPPRSAGRAPPPSPSPSSRPARDRVMEFGKHRGQMLGTLPPSYLRWVAEELDYGEDTAPWAELAREVLADPVYADRAEWDHAHRFLRGDAGGGYDDYDGDGPGPLQEMAERFGWDLSDEDGWSRLDLRLLGTSFGGRIPRKKQSNSSSFTGGGGGKKGSVFGGGGGGGGEDADGVGGKRDERRERVRMRREEQVRAAKMDMLGVNAGVIDGGGVMGKEVLGRKQAQIRTAKKEILGIGRGGHAGAGEMIDGKRAEGNGGQGGAASPFPGRQAFLDKVRKLKGDS